jgi:hypothetical protein
LIPKNAIKRADTNFRPRQVDLHATNAAMAVYASVTTKDSAPASGTCCASSLIKCPSPEKMLANADAIVRENQRPINLKMAMHLFILSPFK